MFKSKAPDGTNNLCGKNIKRLRLQHNPPLSQHGLAIKMQLEGYHADNHVIRRIENGERFVTDIEIQVFHTIFQVPYEELFRPIPNEEE